MHPNSDVKAIAGELGFHSTGIASTAHLPEAERAMVDSIKSGRMSLLPWFTEERARVNCRPTILFQGARSVVSVAAAYPADRPTPPSSDEPLGAFARYAWGDDYHQVMKSRLFQLRSLVARQIGRPAGGPACVDTARVAERAFAQRAGVGWMGKSTNLIVSRVGSWVLLGELLLGEEIDPDVPAAQRCGRCDACISACPSGAIVAPYTVDARRCVSTLTIELRGPIPIELRPSLGDRVFGCDICQEVCPHNRHPSRAHWEEFRPRPRLAEGLPLRELISLSELDFRRIFVGSAILRTKRNGLRRNALVAAGNAGDRALVAVITAALEDPDPVIRSHAAWALGRCGGASARAALESARAKEPDVRTLGEIDSALHIMRL